jgi:DNA polymerase III delta subunit
VAAKPKAKFKDYLSAMSLLKKIGSLPTLSVVFGNSEFLVNDTCQIFQKLWIKSGNQPANSLEAKSLNSNTFSEIWEQSSLFEPKNLTVIRRCQDNRTLQKLLKEIPKPESILNPIVFIYDTEKPNAYALKELKRLNVVEFPCTEPWPNELPPLINQLCKRKNISLNNEALNLLLESVGTDLIKVENELNKFSMIFASASKELTTEDIGPYLGMLRADHAFELDKHLTSKNWSKAHALLFDLINRGETPLKILGLLARHCRHSIRVLAAQNSGVSPRDLAFQLRLPPSVVTSYGNYVKGKKPQHFAKALEICREIDQLCKSRRISEDLMLSRIIEHLAL